MMWDVLLISHSFGRANRVDKGPLGRSDVALPWSPVFASTPAKEISRSNMIPRTGRCAFTNPSAFPGYISCLDHFAAKLLPCFPLVLCPIYESQ